MFLTPSNVAPYLMDSGLVPPRAVVEEDFFLVEVGRRNRNFKVCQNQGRGLFIKQIKTTEPQAIATLQREALFYQRISNSGVDPEVQRIVPRLLHYHPVRYLLMVELVPDSESMAEYHSRDLQRMRGTAKKLGRALAILHRGLALTFSPWERSLFPLQLPWALDLDRIGYEGVRQFGPVGAQLAASMQRIPGFDTLLGSLRSLWQWETVTHGDLKWENVLFYGAGDPESQLHVVDWELVDYGDSAWDVASILKEHVIYGLFALLNGNFSGQPRTVNADAGIAACAASAAEFFQEYTSAWQIPATLLPPYAGRCIRFTAARIVMAVLEYLYSVPATTQVTDLMLQTALSFLQHPQQAAWNLLNVAGI